MNVFELFAKLGLDSSGFEAGLESARRAGSSFGSGLASAAKVGLQAVTMATTAMVGMGAASVKTGAEFDASMSQVAATMGTTVDEIQNLRDFAMEMGRTTAFSATQSADALNYMALAGYDAEKSMNMLPNVLNLAAAGAMDLARASDMVTDTQTAFGISIERTTQMVDEMAKAASTGNTSVEQLGDAFLTVGGLAQELNGGMVTLEDGTQVAVDGIQELEIALTAMANAGIKGSEAGTHMRNMLLKLSSPTSDGVAQLEALGVAVFDTEGNMRSLQDVFSDLNGSLSTLTQEEKITAISDLFNTRDLASAEALLNAVSEDWDEIGASILQAGDVSSIVGDSLNGMVDEMQYNWERLGEDAEAFSKEMKDYLHFEYDLDESHAQAAIDAFVESMQNGATSAEELREAVGSVGGAASEMAKTQLDNLAGDVTLFQSALEGAKIAISDKLTPSLRRFVQFGTDGLSRLTDAFQKDGLNGAMKVFGELLSEGLEMIVEMLPEFVDGGIQLLEALGKGIIDNLSTLTAVATEIISKLGTALTQNMSAMIQAGSDILSGLLNAIIDNLDTITPIITDFIVGFVRIMTDNADKMIEVAIAIASAIGEGLIQSAPIIAEKAPEIIDALTSAIMENPAALIALGPNIISMILKGIKIASPLIKGAGKLISSNLGSSITTTLPSVLSKFGTALTSGLSSAVSFATADMGATFAAGGTTALATAAAAVIGSIVAFFGGAEIGKKLGGLIFPNDEDMYDAYSGIAGTLAMLKDLFFAVIDYVKFEWEDFINGIKTDATNAWTVIKGVYSAVGEWFESIFNGAKVLITAIWDGVKAHFENVWAGIKFVYDAVTGWFEETFQSAYDAVTGVWDSITGFFDGVWTNIKNAFKLDQAYQWGKDLLDNFAKGVKDNIGTIVSACTGVSSTITDYIGFSEPSKGPLSRFHTFAPDMIDLFASGIKDGKSDLQGALSDTFAMPEVDAKANLSYNSSEVPVNASAVSGGADIMGMITDALAGVVVEVNIGTERLDDMISTSIQRTAYRSGGR